MICEVVKGLIIGLVVFMIAVGLTWMIYGSPLENKPTAMDVYQGKTTLEITYKDTIAIDSVVVFKDKEEQK